MRVSRLLLLSISMASINGGLFAADAKEDLYLVVGSARKANAGNSEILLKIHGKEVDCSHEHTFDGQATTFDLEPCQHPRHIMGDATTYDFSRYNIKKVFIERLFTDVGDCNTPGEHNNLIGKVIKNLHPHMVDGASLEIELDPCLKFFFSNIDKATLCEFRYANPFHAWNNFYVAYDALIELKNQNLDEAALRKELLQNDDYTDEMVEEVLIAIKELRTWVEKLAHASGIPYSDLANRVAQEMTIYHYLHHHRTLYNVVSLLRGGAGLDISEFNLSYDNKCYYWAYPHERGELLRDRNGNLIDFRFYNINAFFNGTFSNALLSFYAVEKNREFLIDYLEKNGFTNIKIELANSPYNERQNYWIVSAIKK